MSGVILVQGDNNERLHQTLGRTDGLDSAFTIARKMQSETIAIQTAIPFSSQIEVNILLANRQMPQRYGFGVFKELGGFLPAPVTDRIAAG